MSTAKLNIESILVRNRWTREGLLEASNESFWSPLTNSNKDAVVYLEKNISAGDGHTVVFDFDGNLSGKAIKGNDTAYGKGEDKRKFSSSITVDRYRLVVNNGNSFDGVDIGNLNITQHLDSRKKLSTLFQNFKDQTLFDASQSLLGQAPSHIIDVGTTFSYNTLLDIEKTLKTSSGFSTGGIRRPLVPYRTGENRMPYWLFVVDPAMAGMLKKDSGYQAMVFNADVRGNGNRAIKGVFGKIGQLLIVEASQYFGETHGTGNIQFNQVGVEMPGLRQKDGNNVWTGQEGFSYSAKLTSRGILLGAGALQLAMGKQPDYKHQESTDFGISSESACEFWMNTQKTRLKAENTDYEQAKVAGIDYGIVAVDAEVQSA